MTETMQMGSDGESINMERATTGTCVKYVMKMKMKMKMAIGKLPMTVAELRLMRQL